MFEEISFPEHEYKSIQNYLNKLVLPFVNSTN